MFAIAPDVAAWIGVVSLIWKMFVLTINTPRQRIGLS
jgi:hypothetical protein